MIGYCTDHINTDLISKKINIDVTPSGYIRLFFNEFKGLKWELDNYAISTMTLIEGIYINKKTDIIINLTKKNPI